MHTKTLLHYVFFALSLTYAGMLLHVGVPGGGSAMWSLVIRHMQPAQPQWLTITAAEVESGATIPAGTNVVMHLPSDMATTVRSVLLGPGGTYIRYWGYCFPENFTPDPRTEGLPGKVFLSEKERAWRMAREAANQPTYSIYNLPPDQQLSDAAIRTIRHQLERFNGGTTCYIMTEYPLPLGTDRDFDGLNIQREKTERTNPLLADTDGDGINDSLEVDALKTNPLLRDSDSDGLIDGFEDRNRNGITDPGETDPLKKDTDGDGLCDGLCSVSNSKRICRDFEGRDCINLPYTRWMGEDKNLNGILDLGETSPLTIDTNGDGILDDQEYYNCLLEGKTDC